MDRRLLIFICFTLISCGLPFGTNAQYKGRKVNYNHTIDSLDIRISEIQLIIPKLQEFRNLEFHNVKRELDHTIFLKAYYEYLNNEELDKAKELTEIRLEKSEYRNDGLSVTFYNKYKKHIYEQIKYQRMYYQQLFLKEKTFRKYFESYLKERTLDSYEKAKRMTELSIKYAGENKLVETEKYLQKYNSYINALIFDYHSPFDLSKLAGNQAAFEKAFFPLVSSDSLEQIKKAEELIKHCRAYAINLNGNIDTLHYAKKRVMIASALSDYYDRSGKNAMQNNSDQLMVARIDSLNQEGVYKWHNYIVVINEFTPKYTSPNLKKGEAIMESDRKLFNYIRRQEIGKVSVNYKLQGTRFIPFRHEEKMEEFVFNYQSKKWQYIICYEVIENSSFTAELRKYMPPLIFKQEAN